MGALILAAGFLGFNGGSQGSISAPGDGAAVSKAVVNTVLSGAGGALCGLFAVRLGAVNSPAWGFAVPTNAMLAGMVRSRLDRLPCRARPVVLPPQGCAATPFCALPCAGVGLRCGQPAGDVGRRGDGGRRRRLLSRPARPPAASARCPHPAFLGPAFSHCRLLRASPAPALRLHCVRHVTVDDPLDAAPVHLGAGFWGLFAGPLLTPDGILYAVTSESLTVRQRS